jgi:hypothetical protein
MEVSDYANNYFRDGYVVLSESEKERGIEIFPKLTPAKMNSIRNTLIASNSMPRVFSSRKGECEDIGKGEWFSVDNYPNSIKVFFSNPI